MKNITIGTNHFPTYNDACIYYRQYNHNSSWAITESSVDSKIETDEIVIGKPPIKDGQELLVIDNRYHIQG